MKGVRINTLTICPLCGAAQVKLADECWLCGTSRGADGELGTVSVSHTRGYSLRTLFIITTFAAVCCGLMASLSAVGFLLSLFVVAVGARTAFVLKRRRENVF